MTKLALIRFLLPYRDEIFQRERLARLMKEDPLGYIAGKRVDRLAERFMPFAESIDNSILDHYVGKATWTAPAAIWIGFSTTAPGKTGASVTEATGGGYARIQVTATEFDAAASSANTTNAEQAFAQATGDWSGQANMTDLIIYTASTAGTFIGFKALAVAKPVLNGDTAKIAAGDLDMTMGGAL